MKIRRGLYIFNRLCMYINSIYNTIKICILICSVAKICDRIHSMSKTVRSKEIYYIQLSFLKMKIIRILIFSSLRLHSYYHIFFFK